jgi:uncharacterized membrane-anchored protein
MVEYFRILATSWPLAVMFIAVIAGGIALYVIRWFKKSDQEDKAYRSQQALVVRERRDY